MDADVKELGDKLLEAGSVDAIKGYITALNIVKNHILDTMDKGKSENRVKLEQVKLLEATALDILANRLGKRDWDAADREGIFLLEPKWAAQ
jgi:hypothetical protein